MPAFVEQILNWIMVYDEAGNPKMFESFFAFFAIIFMLYFLLEAFAIVKSATKSVM